MANLKLQYGLLSTMPSTLTEGQFLVATDVEKAFVDVSGIRVPLGDVVTSYTESQITSITAANALPKLYLSSDTLLLYYFDPNGGEEDPVTHEYPGAWTQVGGSVSFADKASKDAAGNVITTTYETKTDATDKYNNVLAQIAAINSFEIRLLSNKNQLPDPPEKNVIFFVPANAIDTNPGDPNVYDEYIYVVSTPAADAVVDPDTGDVITPAVAEVGKYELIGTTETDLTNYYTKTETDAIETALYTALGFTKSDAEDASFVSVDDRLSAVESATGTDASDITELKAKFGNYDASTTQGFVSVEDRFLALEGRMDTEEAATSRFDAELGTLDSTDPDYVTVADRLDALESDSTDADAITEINAKLGNYLDSTDNDFVSVEDRFQAAEGRLDTAESDIDDLQTEVGAASNPDAASLRGRMATAEDDITEINAKLGNMASSTSQGFESVETRLSSLENDTADADAVAEINAKLGNMADSTDADFVSVEDRLSAEETATARFDAELGTLDSTDPDYVTVADRLDAEETATARFDAELGTLDSTDPNYVTVADRLSAVESATGTDASDITELKAKFGSYAASTAQGFVSVEDRFLADEADITEINAKLGNMASSTSQGFESVETRLSSLVSAVGNINRFEVQVIPAGQNLPATGEPYTLYFKHSNAIPTNPDYNVFDEYMWVVKTPATEAVTDPETGDVITPAAAAVYGWELLGTTETDLTNYYTKTEVDGIVGDASTAGTLVYRIKTNEDDIDALESRATALETEVGAASNPDAASLRGRMATAESDIDELQAQLGNYPASDDNDFVSIEDRFEAAETRLNAIEGGAVAQTEDDDNAEKPVLVSGSNNHDTVEYVPDVTVNASTGGVTANQITLGAATLTYDTTTGALVVNYS